PEGRQRSRTAASAGPTQAAPIAGFGGGSSRRDAGLSSPEARRIRRPGDVRLPGSGRRNPGESVRNILESKSLGSVLWLLLILETVVIAWARQTWLAEDSGSYIKL